MKLLMMSGSGDGLPLAWRLRREGVDVSVYLHSPRYQQNYDGLLPKVTLKNVVKAAAVADTIIFDIVRSNKGERWDAALLKVFGLKPTLPSVFGPIADKLKDSHLVIGDCALGEDLELDRQKGADLAEKMGFSLPEHHEFTSLSEGVRFLKDRDDLWVFKPSGNQDLDLTYVEKFPGELAAKMQEEYEARLGDSIEYMLQRRMSGLEVSSEVWVGKRGLVHYNHTFETKRLMNGDLGPAIGSQANTVWVDHDLIAPITEPLTNMGYYLKGQGYCGPCDANCILVGSVPYFLEWSIREGWDALQCFLSLYPGRLSSFFDGGYFAGQFRDGYAVSQRLTIPPFPYAVPTLLHDMAEGVSIMNTLEASDFWWGWDILSDAGKIKCGGADGIIGAVTATGKTIDEAWGRCYNNIGKMKVASYLQYRTDGLSVSRKRFEMMRGFLADIAARQPIQQDDEVYGSIPAQPTAA
jgi:hypothetical protein